MGRKFILINIFSRNLILKSKKKPIFCYILRSFSDVCQAMSHLSGRTDVTVITIGLGKCTDLYACKN